MMKHATQQTKEFNDFMDEMKKMHPSKMTVEQLDFMIKCTENHKRILDMFLMNLKLYKANFDTANAMMGIK